MADSQFFPINKFSLIQSRTIPGKSQMDFEKGKSLSFLVGPEMCSGFKQNLHGQVLTHLLARPLAHCRDLPLSSLSRCESLDRFLDLG